MRHHARAGGCVAATLFLTSAMSKARTFLPGGTEVEPHDALFDGLVEIRLSELHARHSSFRAMRASQPGKGSASAGSESPAARL